MRCKNVSGLDASRRNLLSVGLALTVASAARSSPAEESAADVAFDRGLHRITLDRTVSGSLTLAPGALLEIAAGVRLTLLGDLIAPAAHIFTGEGRVQLDRSRVLVARPEWWGAVPDDPGIDCAEPIEAALRAHPHVQLGAGDYHLQRKLRVDIPNRRLWGVGRANDARGTRLVGHAADGPVLLIGTDLPPATINDYLRGIDLRSIEVARNSPAPAREADDPDVVTGVMIRHVLDCRFESVRANEHAIGFSARGAVRTYLVDCQAFRSVFLHENDDSFIGFDLDGRHAPISTGANASLYLVDCNARTGNRPQLKLSVGCRILGAFSDTFLIRFETTEVAQGILVDGLSSSLSAAQRRIGHLNLHIDTPVLDQCSHVCLLLQNLSDCAMVDIAAPWLALASSGEAALRMVDCHGATSIIGGQIVGPEGADRTGIQLTRVSGLALSGTKLLRCAWPIEAQASRGLDLVAAILAQGANGPAAVSLRKCEASYVRAGVMAAGGGYAVGVSLEDCENVTVETAGLAGVAVHQGIRVEGAVRAHRTGSMVSVGTSRQHEGPSTMREL